MVVIQDRLQQVCQPGNGGPVEDWINVEQLHQAIVCWGRDLTVVDRLRHDIVKKGRGMPSGTSTHIESVSLSPS